MQIHKVASGILPVAVLAVCGCTLTSDGLELRESRVACGPPLSGSLKRVHPIVCIEKMSSAGK